MPTGWHLNAIAMPGLRWNPPFWDIWERPPSSLACQKGELWAITSSRVIAQCWPTAERRTPACTPRFWQVSARYNSEISDRTLRHWNGSLRRQTPWPQYSLFNRRALPLTLVWQEQKTSMKFHQNQVKKNKVSGILGCQEEVVGRRPFPGEKEVSCIVHRKVE